jgi:hypothetical protein
MLITVCRLYHSRPDAHRVIVALEIAGVLASDTSVISNNCDTWYRAPQTAETAALRNVGATGMERGRSEGTIVGVAIGATAATAASLVTMFAIPGVGTVVGIGWLAAILGSMAIGGITGACSER